MVAVDGPHVLVLRDRPVTPGRLDLVQVDRVFRPQSGEVIVPINAALPIRDAAAFAVTVEAPGGVVVSDRSRLALLAAASS